MFICCFSMLLLLIQACTLLVDCELLMFLELYGAFFLALYLKKNINEQKLNEKIEKFGILLEFFNPLVVKIFLKLK